LRMLFVRYIFSDSLTIADRHESDSSLHFPWFLLSSS